MRFAMGTVLLILGLSASAATAEDIKIEVKGMVCSFCANGLEKKFSAMKGVESVKVDLNVKEIRLKVKDGTTITDDDIRKAVKDAGYNIPENGIQRGKNG